MHVCITRVCVYACLCVCNIDIPNTQTLPEARQRSARLRLVLAVEGGVGVARQDREEHASAS